MATGNILGYIIGDGESATTAGSSSTSKYAKKHDALDSRRTEQLRLEGSKVDKKPKADPQPSSSADQGKHEARWEQMFEKLLDYKEGHGDCLVPNRYEPDPSLGAWVSTQRRKHKIILSSSGPSATSTMMTLQRATKLNEIGFAWETVDPRHVPWEQRYQELVAFKKEYGHCVVPINFKENMKLATWVSTQRQEAKLNRDGRRSSRLNRENKIEKLNAIGFVWVAPRGCSKTLKCLREHGTTYQQEQQARHMRREPTDNNNHDEEEDGKSEGSSSILAATANVSAALAAVLHGTPTMAPGSILNNSNDAIKDQHDVSMIHHEEGENNNKTEGTEHHDDTMIRRNTIQPPPEYLNNVFGYYTAMSATDNVHYYNRMMPPPYNTTIYPIMPHMNVVNVNPILVRSWYNRALIMSSAMKLGGHHDNDSDPDNASTYQL